MILRAVFLYRRPRGRSARIIRYRRDRGADFMDLFLIGIVLLVIPTWRAGEDLPNDDDPGREFLPGSTRRPCSQYTFRETGPRRRSPPARGHATFFRPLGDRPIASTAKLKRRIGGRSSCTSGSLLRSSDAASSWSTGHVRLEVRSGRARARVGSPPAWRRCISSMCASCSSRVHGEIARGPEVGDHHLVGGLRVFLAAQSLLQKIAVIGVAFAPGRPGPRQRSHRDPTLLSQGREAR